LRHRYNDTIITFTQAIYGDYVTGLHLLAIGGRLSRALLMWTARLYRN